MPDSSPLTPDDAEPTDDKRREDSTEEPSVMDRIERRRPTYHVPVLFALAFLGACFAFRLLTPDPHAVSSTGMFDLGALMATCMVGFLVYTSYTQLKSQ